MRSSRSARALGSFFRLCGVALGLVAALILGSAGAYVLTPEGAWTTPTVVMHLQLGPSGGTLDDGAESWGQSAEWALAQWNEVMGSMELRVVRDSSAVVGNGNRTNNVFWSSSIFGTPFGLDTLAVTRQWTFDSIRTEADVIFNTAFDWNSYRGALRPDVEDFHRVAMHEFGHVLGLDHPDELDQVVVAIMNSKASDIDGLQADDIAGAQILYGGPSVTTTTIPPTTTIQSTTTTLPPTGACESCPPEFPYCGPDANCWRLPCETLCGEENCCGGDRPECGQDDVCYAPFGCRPHHVFPLDITCSACNGQPLLPKISALFSKAAFKTAGGRRSSARKLVNKASKKLGSSGFSVGKERRAFDRSL